ncbi:hypothetical protein M3Y97_00108900 [Aphelenchoides bicaudatus]|nr:hypothetical protein M3Y97_00108900 [Aphelenchoides bicaudatus]
MLDELFDRAWSCFNKMDKKPPDRNANPSMLAVETLKRRSSIAGPMVLDPSVLPDRQKLDSEFKQLLQELDLSPTKENELCNQSAEKKWVMILEHQIRQSNLRSAATNPSTTIQRLQEWSRFFPDKYTVPLAVQLLEALAVSLRTENISYVQKFIELDGIIFLTRILAETRNGADCIALPILSCFKALLNSSVSVLIFKELRFNTSKLRRQRSLVALQTRAYIE